MTEHQHPEELLAEYVDGTLGPEDRARVESHLTTCVSCREEISLAGSARQALGTLPQLDVPSGLTWPVLQRARQRRRWLPALPPRVAWATAGAAAVAAAVIGGFVLMGGQQLVRDTVSGPAEGSEQFAPGQGELDESQDEAAAKAETTYPTYRRSGRDYDSVSLASLARDLTTDAKRALEQGFPEPPAAFWTRTTLLSSAARTRRALSCVAEAASPDRSLAPFTVLVARFEGKPAYVGAFLQADTPDRSYDELVLYVVSRDDCALRSFARQRL
jgi:anti-sigma factor RsiW